MSAVLLTGLLAWGTVGAPYSPVEAYESASDDRAGNIRSLKGVILEEGPNNPRIEIGELKLIGLADDERPGFVTAEEATLTDLKISGTIETAEYSFVIPNVKLTGYRGPSFSKDQVSSDIFVHPSINWLGLIGHTSAEAQEFSSGMTFDAKAASDGMNANISLKAGSFSYVAGNDDVTSKWEPVEISFQATGIDEGDEISATVAIGAGDATNSRSLLSFLSAFLTPEDYPDLAEFVSHKANYSSLNLSAQVKIPSEGEDISVNAEVGEFQFVNHRVPSFNLKTRQAVKKIVGDLARGNQDFKEVLEPHDISSIVEEMLSLVYLEPSSDLTSVKAMHIDIQFPLGKMDMDIGSLSFENTAGPKYGSLNYKDLKVTLEPLSEGPINLSIDQIAATKVDLTNVYKNILLPSDVHSATQVIESGFSAFVDSDDFFLELIQMLPIDDFYPAVGNWDIRNLAFSGMGLDVTMDSLTSKQADNPGMPDSGELKISNLTLPPSLLANELGPFAQLLANDDDLVNMSLTYDWQAHSDKGGYEINELEVAIDQGLTINAAIDLGGLPNNWQAVPINEINPISLSMLVGFQSAKVTLTNEGLAERGLDFVSLIMGMGADEAKQFAKDNIGQALLFFLDSAEFAAPLQEALTSFIDEPGTIEIAVQPKAGGNLPFFEAQEKLAEGTSPETLFNYQASASN